jgi:hypothetical protein
MTHFSDIKTGNAVSNPWLAKVAPGNAPDTVLYVPCLHNVQDVAPAKWRSTELCKGPSSLLLDPNP